MHWLAQGLRKVKFRWNQVSSWQHRLLRETFSFCTGKGKKFETCSLFPPAAYERDKKCLTLAAYFLRLETSSLPPCYPLTYMPCDNSRAQQEEESLIFCPGNNSVNEEPDSF